MGHVSLAGVSLGQGTPAETLQLGQQGLSVL